MRVMSLQKLLNTCVSDVHSSYYYLILPKQKTDSASTCKYIYSTRKHSTDIFSESQILLCIVYNMYF